LKSQPWGQTRIKQKKEKKEEEKEEDKKSVILRKIQQQRKKEKVIKFIIISLITLHTIIYNCIHSNIQRHTLTSKQR
jgi:cell division protein FtsL